MDLFLALHCSEVQSTVECCVEVEVKKAEPRDVKLAADCRYDSNNSLQTASPATAAAVAAADNDVTATG